MKISTRRDALFSQLQTVTRAASTRSAVQALSGVLVQARGGAIELRATDMEIGLRAPLAGEIARAGAVVLPARPVTVPRPHPPAGALPAVPGAGGRRARPGAGPGVRRDRGQGGALCLARRD